MNRFTKVITLAISASLLTLGCQKSDESNGPEYDPFINPANFSTDINNPWFPLVLGTTFVYLNESAGDSVEVYVTHETREVMGVNCVVVWDRVWTDGEIHESTYDWYAQDNEGTVWYFGEISLEYENGVVVSTEGSWEAGEDDAKPGIIMLADPQPGQMYRQEFYEDEAEDEAEVQSVTELVEVPYGIYNNCIKTREWTRLQPDFEEFKYYSSGIGQLKTIEDDLSEAVLVEIRTEP